MKTYSKNIFILFLITLITLGGLGALSGQAQAQEAVAEIDGTPYPTLQAALSAAEAGQTVKMLKSIGWEAQTIQVPANNKPITLDLNGRKIENNTFTIPTGAHLTLIDSVGGGKITGERCIEADPIGGGLIYVPGGTFIMESGRISEYAFYGVLVSGNGRFEMNGGLLKFESGYFNDNCPGDGYKHNSGGVNLYDGEGGNPTFSMSGGDMEIQYGSCWSQCVHLQAGSFLMSGGNLNAMQTNAYGVNMNFGTSFEMRGGTITGSLSTGVTGGDVVSISGGEITGNSRGVNISNTFNFSGGSITKNDTGVIIENNSTFNFSGGSIEENGIGIDYQGGSLNLSDAPAKGYGSPTVTGNGSKDDPRNVVLNNNKIHITGPLSASTKVGVYSPTPLGFTEGLENNGKSWNFSSDNRNYGVDLNYEKEAILLDAAAAITADGITTYYHSLQEALDDAQTGQTVRPLKTIDSTVDRFPLTAPEDATVTLDLNGQTIETDGDSSPLIIPSKGELTLTDNSSSGMIRSKGEAAAIVVNGDFTMSGGTVTHNRKAGVILRSGASFTLSGSGSITGDGINSSGSGVFFEGYGGSDTASFVMSGGSISANGGDGVLMEMGTFTMSGGKIETDIKYSGVKVLLGSFTLNGGEILGLEIGGDLYAEGVRIYSGLFEMNGGKISGCMYGVRTIEEHKAYTNINGGEITDNLTGIFVLDTHIVSMSGGSISGNDYGVMDQGIFNLSGGNISGNQTGIYYADGASFNLSDAPAQGYGSPVVTGNNINVNTNDNIIHIADALSESVKLGISMNDPGVFTKELKDRGTAVNFESDDPAYGVGLTAEEEAILGRHLSVSFDSNGGTGNMDSQPFLAGESKALTPNAFTRDHYQFTGWNTEEDGSGTAYEDEQSVTISDDLTLFAQWEAQVPHPDDGIELFPLFMDVDHLPNTGFSSRFAEELPARPQGLAYHGLRISLQIPRLGVDTELVRLPLTDGSWPAEWLGERAGVLEGSALPGEGYSIIAAHNTLNNTEYGPFALLAQLDGNDLIQVRTADGKLIPFRVYASELIAPDDFETIKMIGEREAGSLILLTCENESLDGGYLNRRVVFAKPVL